MNDEIETLMIDVRANTSGLRADLEGLRGTLDSALGAAGEEAGARLERDLLTAIRRSSLGFDDLKRVALGAMDEIAAGAMQRGIGSVLGGTAAGGGQGGMTGLLAGVAGALLGLPGRATDGPVSPGRPYWVGKRGPEVFVPTAAGRIEPAASGSPREVRVSIQLQQPRAGGDAPAALRRSSRQVASSIRRSLRAF